MLAIIVFALAVIATLAIAGAILHFLSWPLVLVAIAIFAWIKVRPRRANR
jgi:hypothetical protein